jgi:phosphotriesterase-related protein
MNVMTVSGVVAAAEIGATLVHEHIVATMPGEQFDPAYAPDRREIVAIATDRLQEARHHGIQSLVDPCPIELGRDPELYAEVSQRSGVRIIFATGFYFEGWGLPLYWRARDPEEIADLYLHELAHGVGKTGLRPGVIKAATGPEVTEGERNALAAAAMAQKQTGVAIITHTEHSRHGEVQQDIFAEFGADLSRVLIGHQDEHASPEPLERIARRGSFVGIDRVGVDLLASDETRADNVAALVKRDYTRQVCLSQDCVCTLTAPRFPFPLPNEYRVSPGEFVRNNKPLSYVLTDFAVRLKQRGVTAADLNTIFRDNPRRLLTGVA